MKKEADTPDLWAEATKTAQLFAGTTDAPDDKFTRTELAQVQGQLRLLHKVLLRLLCLKQLSRSSLN